MLQVLSDTLVVCLVTHYLWVGVFVGLLCALLLLVGPLGVLSAAAMFLLYLPKYLDSTAHKGGRAWWAGGGGGSGGGVHASRRA